MREARSRLRRLARELTGRSDGLLIDLLYAQAASARTAAELCRDAVGHETDAGRARQEVARVEHEGDEHRRSLIAELSRSLVTPIDREDMFRLSRSIDDVVDNLRDFAREWDLYGVGGAEPLHAVLVAVVEVIGHLEAAIEGIRQRPSAISAPVLAAKKAGNLVRYLYQDALAALFAGELDMDVLRQRELLRRLDVVGLRLGEAADALADAAVKRTLL